MRLLPTVAFQLLLLLPQQVLCDETEEREGKPALSPGEKDNQGPKSETEQETAPAAKTEQKGDTAEDSGQSTDDDSKRETSQPGDSQGENTLTVEWGAGAHVPDDGQVMYLVTPTGVIPAGSEKTPDSKPEAVADAPEQKKAKKKKVDASKKIAWRTIPEWFSIGVTVGNHGGGGIASFFTLRWRYFYLETMRVQWGGMDDAMHVFAGSMAGVPFWISEGQEIRAGLGLGGGYIEKDNFTGYMNVPIEASYIYHLKKHFAVQASFTVAFPVVFDNNYKEHHYSYEYGNYYTTKEEDYTPFFSANAALRF